MIQVLLLQENQLDSYDLAELVSWYPIFLHIFPQILHTTNQTVNVRHISTVIYTKIIQHCTYLLHHSNSPFYFIFFYSQPSTLISIPVVLNFIKMFGGVWPSKGGMQCEV